MNIIFNWGDRGYTNCQHWHYKIIPIRERTFDLILGLCMCVFEKEGGGEFENKLM